MMTWGTKQRSNVDTTRGGSRGVASHPPLEQPTKKILCVEKQMEICGSQKPCEAIKPHKCSNHRENSGFVRNLWRCSTLDE